MGLPEIAPIDRRRLIVASEGDQAVIGAPYRAECRPLPIGQQRPRRACGEVTDHDLTIAQRRILFARHANKSQPRAMPTPFGRGIIAFAVRHLHKIAGRQFQYPYLHKAVMHPADAVLFIAQAAHDFDCWLGDVWRRAALIAGFHSRPARADQLVPIGRPIKAGHRHTAGRIAGFGLVLQHDDAHRIAAVAAIAVGQSRAVAAPGYRRGLAVALRQTDGRVCIQRAQIKMADVAVGGGVWLADGIGDLRPAGRDRDLVQPAKFHQVFGD